MDFCDFQRILWFPIILFIFWVHFYFLSFTWFCIGNYNVSQWFVHILRNGNDNLRLFFFFFTCIISQINKHFEKTRICKIPPTTTNIYSDRILEKNLKCKNWKIVKLSFRLSYWCWWLLVGSCRSEVSAYPISSYSNWSEFQEMKIRF